MDENGQGTALATRRMGGELAHGPQLAAADVVSMTRLVQEVMRDVMQKDQHYGVIPGCGDKPALLKPGAEKLCMTFRLAAIPAVETVELGNGHREYRVHCKVVHIPTGDTWGVGVGCCSTMESKYRWRGGGRKCPECGKPAIIKGRQEYGGGWVCFGKKGGCGHKWPDGAKEIEGQSMDRIENPDIADTYNTVLKMAKKRAQVDATLTATAASDIFTQDIEELAQAEERAAPTEPPAAPAGPDPKLAAANNPAKLVFARAAQKWTGLKGADLAEASATIGKRHGIFDVVNAKAQDYLRLAQFCDTKMAEHIDFVAWIGAQTEMDDQIPF